MAPAPSRATSSGDPVRDSAKDWCISSAMDTASASANANAVARSQAVCRESRRARRVSRASTAYSPACAVLRTAPCNASSVECEIEGAPWVQKPFPYQGKCLRALREARAALAPGDRSAVDALLDGTGCEKLFA